MNGDAKLFTMMLQHSLSSFIKWLQVIFWLNHKVVAVDDVARFKTFIDVMNLHIMSLEEEKFWLQLVTSSVKEPHS